MFEIKLRDKNWYNSELDRCLSVNTDLANASLALLRSRHTSLDEHPFLLRLRVLLGADWADQTLREDSLKDFDVDLLAW